MSIGNEKVNRQNSWDTIATKRYGIIWWVLWVGAIVLLEFHYRELDGERIKIAYGQYLFFVLDLAAGLAVYFFCKNLILQNVSSQLNIAFIVLILFLAGSASTGINTLYGLRLLLILTITSIPFVLLGMASVSVQDASKVQPILGFSAGIAVVTCVLSMTGPLTVFDFTLENYFMGDRWAFLFIEANGLAGMMAIGISSVLYYFFLSLTLSEKLRLSLIFLPVLLVVFWQTNSRAALFWIALTGLLYSGLFIFKKGAFHVDNGNTKWLLLLGATIILGILLVLKFWPQLSIFLRINQADLTSGRMEVWLLYLAQLKAHPLLGFGFGASDLFMADFVPSGLYKIAGPLNVFIGILGETGLLGMVAMLYIWVGAILKSWRVVRQRAKDQDGDFHYAFFLLVMLLSLAAQQNGEWLVLRVTPINYLFFFLVSAAWTLEKKVALLQTKTPSLTVQ